MPLSSVNVDKFLCFIHYDFGLAGINRLIEMDSDAKKRRSSTGILKAQKPRNPFKEVDFNEPTPNVNKSRRVSFASSNFVKPFSSDADKVTVWDATYEEEIEHTDSTQSSREQTESKNVNTFNTSSLNSLLDYQDSSTEEIVHVKQPPVEVLKIWISDEDSINERCSGKKIVEECVHPVVSDSLNKENFNPLINDISGIRNTVKETNETSSKRNIVHINESSSDMEMTTNLSVKCSISKDSTKNTKNLLFVINESQNDEIENTSNTSEESLSDMEFTQNLPAIINEQINKTDLGYTKKVPLLTTALNTTANEMEITTNLFAKSITEGNTYNCNTKEISESMECTKNLPIMNLSCKSNIDDRRHTQLYNAKMEFTQNLDISENKEEIESVLTENNAYSKIETSNESVVNMEFTKNLSAIIESPKPNIDNKRRTQHYNDPMECTRNLSPTVNKSCVNSISKADESSDNNELIRNLPVMNENANYNIDNRRYTQHCKEGIKVAQNLPVNVNKNSEDMDDDKNMVKFSENLSSTEGNKIESSQLNKSSNEKESVISLSGNNSNHTKTLSNLSQNNSNIIYSEPMKIKVNTNLECIAEQHADLLQPFDNYGSVNLNTSGLKTPFKSFQMTLSNGNLSPSIEDTQHLINVRISEPNPGSTNNSMLNENTESLSPNKSKAENKSLLSGKCEEDNHLVETFANNSNINHEVIVEQIVEFPVPNFSITETFTGLPYFNNSNIREVPNKLTRLSIEDIKNVAPSVSEKSMEVDENIELLILDPVNESDMLDKLDPFLQEESFSEEESNISLPKVNMKIFKENLTNYDIQDDSQLLKEIAELRQFHIYLNTFWETTKNLFEGDLLPPLKLPDVQLISNLEESEEDAKVEETDKIDNCIQSKVISLTEQILEKAERSRAWKIDPCKIGDDSWVFSSFQGTVKFSVEFHFETGIVSSIETTNNLKDSCYNFCFYLVHVFRERLEHGYLKTVLGYRYDILTLLDYVEMLVDELTKHHIEIREMQCKYGLEVSRDNIFSFKILNRKLIISWNITVNMTNIHNVSFKDITAKSGLEYGEQVNEEHIQSLANRCSKGTSFLKNFIDNILEYVALIEKRKRWRKQK